MSKHFAYGLALFSVLLALSLIIISCSQRERDRIQHADALEKSGIEAAQRKDYAQAFSNLQRALEENLSLNRTNRVAEISLMLAKLRLRLVQLDEAISSAQRALQAYSAIADRRGEIEASRLIGEAYLTSGDVDKAEAAFNAALTTARVFSIESPPSGTPETGITDTIAILSDLARCALAEGLWSQAASLFEMAWRESGAPHGQTEPRNVGRTAALSRNYANALFLSGDSLHADNILRRSILQSLSARDSISAFETALYLVRSDMLRKNQVDAQADLAFAAGLQRAANDQYRLLIDFYFLVGELTGDPSAFATAESLALQHNDTFAFASSLLLKADYVPGTTKSPAAGARLATADSLFRLFHFDLGNAVAAYERGKFLERIGQLPAALNSYRQAAEIAESIPIQSQPVVSLDPTLRGRILRWSLIDWYEPIVRLNAALKQLDAAFEASEQRLARELVKEAKSINFSSENDSVTNLINISQSLARKIFMLRSAIVDDLINGEVDSARAAALRTSLAASVGSFFATLQSIAAAPSGGIIPFLKPTVLQAAEIRRRLNPGSVLVEYHIGSNSPLAFVATRKGIAAVQLPSVHSLYAFTAFITKIKDAPSPADPQIVKLSKEILRSLQSALVDPLRKAIPLSRSWTFTPRPAGSTVETEIIVVPPIEFRNLPFQMIFLRAPLSRGVSSVRVVPLASTISWQRCDVDTANPFTFVIGNPSGMDWDIEYVLRDVRSLLKDVSVNVATSATWNALSSAKGLILFAALPWSSEKSQSPSFFLSSGTESQSLDNKDIGALLSIHPFPLVMFIGTGGQWDPWLSAALLMAHGSRNIIQNLWRIDSHIMRSFDESFFTGGVFNQQISFIPEAAGKTFFDAMKTVAAQEETSNLLVVGGYVLYGWGNN